MADERHGSGDLPHPPKMKRKRYERELLALQVELVKAQYWIKRSGERVVRGQRMMQAASDIFLGWTKGVEDNRYFYWRQLRDMKASALVEGMSPFGLTFYARMCGWTLARAHARSGDAIAEYLGPTTPSITPSPISPPATPTRTNAITTASSKR